jgi:ADP-heptose:LPS heptosyltransferase
MSPATGRLLKRLDRVGSYLASPIGNLIGQCLTPDLRQAVVLRPGGMGDLICAQIAVETLGVPLPGIEWMIERRAQPWADYMKLSYRLFDSGVKLGPARAIVINTEQRFGLSQGMALALRGKGGKLFSFDTNRAARWSDVTTLYDPYDTHEVQSFIDLFSDAFGLQRAACLQRERRWPVSQGIVVGVAGRQESSRALPVESWVELINRVAGRQNVTIVAAPQDREFAKGIQTHLSRP